MPRRFLTFEEVAEELAISKAQLYALVRRRDLVALKIGGRGQWRIERSKLEDYIARTYEETERFITDNPFPARGEIGEDVGNPGEDV